MAVTLHYTAHVLTGENVGHDISRKFLCPDMWQANKDAQVLCHAARERLVRTHFGEGKSYRYIIVPGSVRVRGR